MTAGAAGEGTADVLLAVEQLRRPVPGGIGTYVAGLVAGLVAEPDPALSVRLVASRGPRPDPLADLGLPLSTSRWPGRLATLAPANGVGPQVPGRLRHATSFALPAGRAPLVVTVHDLAFLHLPDAYPRRGRRWHVRALRRALVQATAFVVPSTSVADGLIALGVAPSAVAVIEEGADHLPPPDHVAADALLAHLGVEPGYCLSVSTLEPRKNLPRLLGAFARARERLAEVPALLVVGPNGWGTTLPPAAGVHLVGAVRSATLAALYERAGLFCYVPLEEGFGLPVVEAMAAGTPVLSSPVPAAGGATRLVDPLDVAAIAEGIVALRTDPGLAAALVAAGRRRVAPLTWRASAAAHRALWHGLLESDGARR